MGGRSAVFHMPSPLAFLKNLTTGNHRDIHRRNPGKLRIPIRRTPAHQEPGKKVAHGPASKSPIGEHNKVEPRLQSQLNLLFSNFVQEFAEYEFHSSIPNGSMEGWRNFPPPRRAETMTKDEGPVMKYGGFPSFPPSLSGSIESWRSFPPPRRAETMTKLHAVFVGQPYSVSLRYPGQGGRFSCIRLVRHVDGATNW